MKKRWYAVLSLVIVSVLITGCIDFSALQPKEPVTIQVMIGEGQESYFEGLLEEFNKEYDYITVEFVTMRRFFGGRGDAFDEVDVLTGSQYMMRFFTEEGGLVSLNELMAQDDDFDLNDFYKGGVDALSTDGTRWGVPVIADILVMHYNKDMFDVANVPYPQNGWTWSDFMPKATALTDLDRGQYGYAYHYMGELGFLEPMLIMEQFGGGIFDDMTTPTKMTLNTPNNVMAMQWYGDMINKEHVSPQAGERRQPYPDMGIEGQKFAMWMGWLSENWEDVNTGVVQLPSHLEAATLGSVTGVFISTSTNDVDASWAWCKFVSEQSVPYLMPMRISLAQGEEMDKRGDHELVEAGLASLPTLIPWNISMDGPMGMTWGQSMSTYQASISEIRAGENAQTSLDEAQRKLDQ